MTPPLLYAYDARVTWNEGGPVHVSTIKEPDSHRDDRFSDGACYKLWRDMDPQRSTEMLLDLFARLVLLHRCEPAQVSEAFDAIFEWHRWRVDSSR